MNIEFAKEVGILRYVARRLLWRVAPPASIKLSTGVAFPTPRQKFFASDAFVTEGNIDWNAEYILAAFLKAQDAKRDFLDVGAHLGYYSCVVSPFVRNIWAFEPDARNIPFLKVALKGLPNARVIPQGVADQDGEAGFSDGEESSISHIEAPGRGRTIRTVRLDSFVRQNSLEPGAIKIDIEGFDILALCGATETAAMHQPVFLVEYNQEPGRPNTWQGLGEFIKSVHYVVYAIARRNRGLLNCEYSFARRDVATLPSLFTKMLFLIPKNAEPWFAAFSQKRPQWTNRDLRPSRVRALLADR